MPITYRLYEPRDVEQTVEVIHRVFHVYPIPYASWARMESHDHATVLAEQDGRLIGAIPFDIRDFLIRPGVSLRAAFAHLVSVDALYRNAGVGSGMMKFAKENLPAVCDGLFVYTGSEGRAPYTFYEKNGFVDLQYSRFYSLPVTRGAVPADVQVVPFDPAALGEQEICEAYQRAYAEYAGFPVRFPGFWEQAMDSIIYVEIPTDFHLAQVHRGAELCGYAIFGFAREGATILEMVVTPQDDSSQETIAEKLLIAVIAAVAERDVPEVRMLASSHHPALLALHKLGFQPNDRSDSEIISGFTFHFDRLWTQLAGEKLPWAKKPPLALHIWTPEGEFDLPGDGPRVTLEMKYSTLQRLFLCREDFRAAFETERITSPDAALPWQRSVMDALQHIFRPAPWVYHWLEWI